MLIPALSVGTWNLKLFFDSDETPTNITVLIVVSRHYVLWLWCCRTAGVDPQC